MATVGENKIGGTTYIKEYFNSKPTTSTESIKVNATISAPSETKGSILSVFNQKFNYFLHVKHYQKCLRIMILIWKILVEKNSGIYCNSR